MKSAQLYEFVQKRYKQGRSLGGGEGVVRFLKCYIAKVLHTYRQTL